MHVPTTLRRALCISLVTLAACGTDSLLGRPPSDAPTEERARPSLTPPVEPAPAEPNPVEPDPVEPSDDPCVAACAPAPAGSCLAPPSCDPDAVDPADRCAYADRADGAACLRDEQAPGVCDAGTCVECITAADCQNMVDNAAGCFLIACNAGVCEATQRHDGEDGFAVEPVFTDEIHLGDSGVAKKALFDGENFMVWMGVPGSMVGRRVTPEGEVLPGDIALDPLTADLDVVHYPNPQGERVVRYYAVTQEGAEGSYFGFPYIGGYQFGEDGTRLGPKAPVITSNGGVCPTWNGTLTYPRVAGSGSSFLVMAAHQNCWASQGLVVNVATGGSGSLWFDVTLYVMRFARPFAAAGGFFIETEEKRDTPAGNSIGGAFINGNPNGQNSPTPYNPQVVPPFSGNSSCCWDQHAVVWGQNSFLQIYSWAQSDLRVRRLGTNGSLGEEHLVPGGHYQGTQVDVQAGFDSRNFLLIGKPSGDTVPAFRIRADGTFIDTAPLGLSPAGDGIEGSAKLTSDRAGRYLVAYTKSDGDVYARLFSTCP